MSSSDVSGLVIYLVIWGIAFLACFFLAIIPSKIAKKKGYSGVGFYFFGLVAFVPAIIVASVLRDRSAASAQQPQYQPPQPPQYQPPQQPQYQPPQQPPQG